MKNLFKIIILYTGIVFYILNSNPVQSCNVPVFRYALERWPSEPYEVIVFHRGPLSTHVRSDVEWLENLPEDYSPHANFKVQVIDPDSIISGSMLNLWKTLESPELPCLVLLYPVSTGIRKIVWSGRLERDAVLRMVDSPARREITERILDGESAVWILLESGDINKDNAAAEMLESQLSYLEDVLRLPGTVDYTDDGTAGVAMNATEQRIAFSIIRISREDTEESMFINMLMNSEPGLYDFTSYPMAFPVYGRGRVLYALVGNGISERNIQRACSFLTGACSCEVKALNPGIDLLMAVDWDSGIDRSWVSVADIPPLVGLSQLASLASLRDSSFSDEPAPADSSTAVSEADTILAGAGSGQITGEDVDGSQAESRLSESQVISDGAFFNKTAIPESHGYLLRNILIAIGIIILVIFALSLKVVVNKTGGRR